MSSFTAGEVGTWTGVRQRLALHCRVPEHGPDEGEGFAGKDSGDAQRKLWETGKSPPTDLNPWIRSPRWNGGDLFLVVASSWRVLSRRTSTWAKRCHPCASGAKLVLKLDSKMWRKRIVSSTSPSVRPQPSWIKWNLKLSNCVSEIFLHISTLLISTPFTQRFYHV